LNTQKITFVVVSFLSLFAIHPITNFLATEDFSDERYYLSISTFSGHSTDHQSTRLLRRLLVSLAVENSLLAIGEGLLARTINQLRSMHNSSLLDCLDHPEYLSTLLKASGSVIYQTSINSIKAKLKEIANDEEIAEFLQKIIK
jgi:hypothetical protein